MKKYKLEYVWLDGYNPEPNLRSKIKIVDSFPAHLSNLPLWNFDGSSTKQADTGSSDCILRPVKMYHSHKPETIPTIYVMCEVLNPDMTPHPSNYRSMIIDDEDFWFGFEQEYFIKKDRYFLGHDTHNLEPQGKYYCGVGNYVEGRNIVDEHLDYCLTYGIDITGINAEVALGQWEYQVFSKGKLNAGDDLWMTRYFLHKISEKYGYTIELHPKPLLHGDWNGSGLHTNFSNKEMREVGGEEYFKSIFKAFETRHEQHIEVYGSDNNLRLTGKYETQSIDKFSWGISDRGASIRVPKSTSENWKGYLEDRRPGSNADPYKIINVIDKTLKFAVDLSSIHHAMYNEVDIENIKGKYNGILSDEELLNEYKQD